MSEVPATLIIPTWNGGALFRRVLGALGELDPRPREVFVVDSESGDGTDRAAEEFGASVVRIPRAEFDHGGTRQMAVERARTELVAFLSQDAVPARDYLGELARAFEDEKVAGASARILPPHEASAMARRTVLDSPMASDRPRLVEIDPEEFQRLSPGERRALLCFDNVASMARRDVLLRLPFARTMMGEDADFAERALLGGWKLAFVPGAVVRHAHEYGPLTAFRRYREDARWVRRRFGLSVRPTLFSALRGLAYECREDARFFCRPGSGARAGDWLRSPLVRGGQVLGQWRGSQARAAS